MKKGFTLVEVLGVIIIIGIIYSATVLVVTDLIKEARYDIYKSNELIIANAAESYFLDNTNLLPQTIGDTESVSISDLIAGSYMKEYKNSINKELCLGYVNITSMGDNEYKYTPYLDCTGSGASDGNDLILHYDFNRDDEATRNLVLNPAGDTITSAVPGGIVRTWDMALHTDAITVANWSTGHNSGVPSQEIGYHAMWVYKDKDNLEDPIMHFRDLNYEFGLGHRWLGISASVGTPSTLGITHGQKVTISWDQKSTSTSKGVSIGLYHYNLSAGTRLFGSNIQMIAASKVNEWERVSYTTTIDTDWDLTKNLTVYVYGHHGDYGEVWVDNVQIELQKSLANSFVTGEKPGGTIIDFSKNNRHVTPTFASSPKWVDGAYEFDGNRTYISTLMPKINGPYSISLWAKRTKPFPPTAPGFGGLAGFRVSTELLQGLAVYSNNEIYYRDYLGSPSGLASGVIMDLDEWYHTVLTFNGTTTSLYVNGELKNSAATTRSATASGEFQIGSITWRENDNRAFAGQIDDVMVYNRALSSEEVKFQYDTNIFDKITEEEE